MKTKRFRKSKLLFESISIQWNAFYLLLTSVNPLEFLFSTIKLKMCICVYGSEGNKSLKKLWNEIYFKLFLPFKECSVLIICSNRSLQCIFVICEFHHYMQIPGNANLSHF